MNKPHGEEQRAPWWGCDRRLLNFPPRWLRRPLRAARRAI